MDILKGISILLIILTHYSFTDESRSLLLFPYWVNMAVPVFMIVSGYVSTKAYYRRDIHGLAAAYEPKYKLSSILRILIPYLFVFVIEVFIGFFREGWSTEALAAFLPRLFIMGGRGPGAYYVPLMIGFILFFPIPYLLIDRFGFAGLCMAGALNIIYELCRIWIGIPDNIEVCLIFRYTLVLSYGSWLASDKYRPHPIMGVIALILGALFIYGVCYGGYEPLIFNQWRWTSAAACLYIIPIIGFVVNKEKGLHCSPLELLGQASFNIFLIQKLWYYLMGPAFGMEGSSVWTVPVRLILSFAFCLAMGISFYKVESGITKRITSAARLR